jgi:hypothetical protein
MNEKIRQVSRYWNHTPKAHDYSQIDASILQPFTGTHPAIVQPWFKEYAELVFTPDPDYRLSKREKRHRWQMKVEKMLNRDLTKKHYQLVQK